MTVYRFRVRFAPDPTSLWRNIVVGADRTITEFQSAINPAVGLNQSHLWFIEDDEECWDSKVKYQCPQEYEQLSGSDLVFRTEWVENTGEVTIGEVARQSDLEQYDRICYLYDYGDEWRFYAILNKVLDNEPRDTEPAVMNTEGDFRLEMLS
jgi:hypothetical protein